MRLPQPTHYSIGEVAASRVGVLNGLPLPIVKPLVPSGILGPLELCFADASLWFTLFNCGDGARSPRPLWFWVLPRALPRPRAHPFFCPTRFSSAYQSVSWRCNVKFLNLDHLSPSMSPYLSSS